MRHRAPIVAGLLLTVAAFGAAVPDAADVTVVTSPAPATATVTATHALAPKLHGDLAAVLAAAEADELIPIVAVMRDQAPRAEIDRFSKIADRRLRRSSVANVLEPLAQRTQQELLDLLRAEESAGRAARIRSLWITNLVAADVTPAMAHRIAARVDVDHLSHNPQVPIFEIPREEEPPAQSGNIECGVVLMGAPDVWNDFDIIGRDVVVGLVDSGTCYRHPDLENHIWNNPGEIPDNEIDDDKNGFVDDVIGWNFHLGNNDPDDFLGHGTHVGGTIVGDGTGGTVTGMARGAKLMLLRVSGQISEQEQMWAWSSMQYTADNGAHILSMSYGWNYNWGPDRKVWRDVSLNVIAMGTIPVIAAHNFGNCCPPTGSVATPGDVPENVTIGATDCADVIAGFSSRGPVTWETIDPYNDWPYPPGKMKPTVSAPGVNTTSTRRCSGYVNMSGTSMATPHASGAVALMLEANPNLTMTQVKQILIDTSIDLGDPGWDNAYGAGRLDAHAAVQAALDAGGGPGDVDGDGDVDFDDMLLLLNAWGPVPDCPPTIPADIDEDCDVDFDDLLLLLTNWT